MGRSPIAGTAGEAAKTSSSANLTTTGGHPWDPPDWAGGRALPRLRRPNGTRPPGLLRAKLDAYYARLYGLTHDELRYILDPKDVYGPEFPGETSGC